ncbi:predicted protein [Verticillium alfalfae VaMs.102]|uniref:Predicted protein n=1 Tax=Verticillium alfalfae (strain VaMs.102 / ATCC MYA-4576 / FGSC 10136) TaxID=526221 RepID=C9SB51_VERA1|nr:predicted protein [Verticillium alfalfae VaMs.102]EEY15601.1 predicted protein [Verticillium alfalfae VaMs.102]
MADTDDAGGLFSIAISDSEDEAKAEEKKQRAGQSEEEFRAIKASYKAKIENGEIWMGISLPLEESANKPVVQELLHAVEELYFFRRYEEGARFARRVLETSGGRWMMSTERVLTLYEKKMFGLKRGIMKAK